MDEPWPEAGPGAPRWPAGTHSGLHVTHPREQSCSCHFQHSGLEHWGRQARAGRRGSWERGAAPTARSLRSGAGGLHHPSQCCPSPSSLSSHIFVPKTASLHHLPAWRVPALLSYPQPHIPGHMHIHPACDRKPAPSVCTPTQHRPEDRISETCFNVTRSMPHPQDPLVLFLPLHTKTAAYLYQRTRTLQWSSVWEAEAGAGPLPPPCPQCGQDNQLWGLVPVVPTRASTQPPGGGPSPLLTCPTSYIPSWAGLWVREGLASLEWAAVNDCSEPLESQRAMGGS